MRCAVALSYDLEMAAGYAPDEINHGRIIPAVQEYTIRLCETAERFGVQLHFFFVCNGLEAPEIGYLRRILDGGHVINSHTYSHQGVALVTAEKLDQELRLANQLLKQRLGVDSTVLRGPYGYKQGWKNLPPENRRVILDNGFQWLSGEYDDQVYHEDWDFWICAPERELPYRYPEGLVEIPFQGWSDRMWFDMRPQVDQEILVDWRKLHGHQPVPRGWRAPWLLPDALDEWISLNLATLDYAYEHGKVWVPIWHPVTHYLHDPENRVLTALLEHAASKPETALVCTVRDLARMLRVNQTI